MEWKEENLMTLATKCHFGFQIAVMEKMIIICFKGNLNRVTITVVQGEETDILAEEKLEVKVLRCARSLRILSEEMF